MDNPADSLPGDHLRPEEQEEVKEALRLHMQAHPALTTSHSQSFQERFQEEVSVLLDGEDVLQPHEKEMFKERLVRFMEDHPIDADERVPLNVRIAEMLTSFARGLLPQTAAAFAVVLVTGGSIAWAAEDTLPGDVLYPVKTGIIEPMRAAMANDPAAKAEKVADCARKRLLEAEKLLSGDRLTEENWHEIQGNMIANLDRADTLIASIAESDPQTAATLSADLNVMLDTYHQVFGEVGVAWSNSVAVDAAQIINSAAVRFAAHHEMNEEKLLSDDVTAETLTKRVVHSVSSIVSRLPVDDGHSDTSTSVRGLLKNAEERLEKGEFRDSLKAARMAIRKAQHAEAFKRLGLSPEEEAVADISSTASSASGMPVTATKEMSSATTITPAAAVTVEQTDSSSVTLSSSVTSSSTSKKETETQSSSVIVEHVSSSAAAIELPPTLPLPPEVTEVIEELPSLLP